MNASKILTTVSAAAGVLLAAVEAGDMGWPPWAKVLLLVVVTVAAKLSASPMQPKVITGFPEDK